MAPQSSDRAAARIASISSHLNYPQGLLAGQVAIVTGSGRGIGAETARLFAKEGAKVVVSDVDGGEFSFIMLDGERAYPTFIQIFVRI
jgi:hypothetical protein